MVGPNRSVYLTVPIGQPVMNDRMNQPPLICSICFILNVVMFFEINFKTR